MILSQELAAQSALKKKINTLTPSCGQMWQTKTNNFLFLFHFIWFIAFTMRQKLKGYLHTSLLIVQSTIPW